MSDSKNCWLHMNRFDNTVKTFWQEFQDEKDFCDVTLACEDKQIKTHKIILSSFSSVLRNILKFNPNPHPLIYLKGVKFQDLQNLIHFMYQGGVSVATEDLSSFLGVAEDLFIRGLSGEKMEIDNSGNVQSLKDTHRNILVAPEVKSIGKNGTYFEDPLPESPAMDSDFDPNPGFEAPSKEENQTIKIDESKLCLISVDGKKQFSCRICNHEFASNTGLSRHIRSIHEGIRYDCNQCDFKGTCKSVLRRHVQSIHYGVRYPCNKCDYMASQMNHLKQHIQSIHEGVCYPCKQCDYKTTSNKYLRTHVQSIHNGVNYPCKQCEYKAPLMGTLKKHVQSVHEHERTTRYPCKQCDYKAKFKGELKKHTLRKHN